ncbi:hypothetical protein [Thalassomonas sp. M1454]|uniref:hypothetical protein n=1 Tax=Thalassomonas sp. M1454 TaxID=2594477 RepID=UPI00118087FE|nr:hypothetical protein [Thalassomonas sp. M1454]TRX57957.1 hypothetical protein FNN08_00795 [Thalassomonas sp. M1454]
MVALTSKYFIGFTMTEKILQGSENGLLCRGDFKPPLEFFNEVVNPNVLDLLRDQGSRRAAFNAASGLYHMAEYVHGFALDYDVTEYNNLGFQKAKGYIDSIMDKCPAFAYVEAIALVTKHYQIGNKRAKEIVESIREVKLVSTGLQSKNVPDPDDGLPPPIFNIDFSKPQLIDEKLVIYLKDGSEIILSEIFVQVRDFWIDEFDRLGMNVSQPFELNEGRWPKV